MGTQELTNIMRFWHNERLGVEYVATVLNLLVAVGALPCAVGLSKCGLPRDLL